MNNKGFTLIELILVVAIMGITVGIAGEIIISITKSYNRNQIANELEEASNFVSLKLEREFRNAVSVSLPTLGNSGQQLNFTDPDGNPICYRVSSSILQRSTGACTSWLPLTESTGTGGILVSGTFTTISTDPAVIRLSLVFAPLNGLASSGITLNNTLVARGSY